MQLSIDESSHMQCLEAQQTAIEGLAEHLCIAIQCAASYFLAFNEFQKTAYLKQNQTTVEDLADAQAEVDQLEEAERAQNHAVANAPPEVQGMLQTFRAAFRQLPMANLEMARKRRDAIQKELEEQENKPCE